MAFLVEFHWVWLAAAAAIGFVMGWIGDVHRIGGLSKKALSWLVLLIAVAASLAAARLVPGRFGYWLDLGMVMFVTYIVGCMIGSWLRGLLVSDPAP